MGISDPEAIWRLIDGHGRWFHEIELAPGIVTPGEDSNRLKLPILDQIGLPENASGLRALDLGCSDGYFAFEMEKRGAQVLAVDFVPEEYTGFAVVKRALGSQVEYRMDNVYCLNPAQYGHFDIVLFLGLLYHLRKPLAALDAVRAVMKEGGQLFLATLLIDEYILLPTGAPTTLNALNPALSHIPLWQAYPRDTLNGDFTNCFAPNRRALEVALEEAQFEVEEFQIYSMGGYVRARAVHDEQLARYQQLDSRLEKAPFDPSVPYFLDAASAKHTVTGRRRRGE